MKEDVRSGDDHKRMEERGRYEEKVGGRADECRKRLKRKFRRKWRKTHRRRRRRKRVDYREVFDKKICGLGDEGTIWMLDLMREKQDENKMPGILTYRFSNC